MKKTKGFTLIEILLTLAIIAILTLFGTAFTRDFLIKNQTTTAVDRIVTTLNLARMEAIKQNEMVTLCGTSDYKTCSDNWSTGQLMQSNTQTLRVFKPLPEGDQLIWKSSGRRHAIIKFSPTGFTGQLGSFFYTPQGKTNYTHKIIITIKGTIRVEYNNERLH